MEIYQDLKQGEKGAWLSIVTYIVLSIFKLATGTIGESEALKADGLNNTTDIIASVAVLIGLKIARKPPDHNHHYGHLRSESIASLIAAFIMIFIGIQVFIDAIITLFSPDSHFSAPSMITAWVALFCAFVMYLVYRYNLALSKKINSTALFSAAQDNRSDALVSIGAATGIFGANLGVPWLDPLSALIVGVLICKTAISIFRETTYTLTDGFDKEPLTTISRTIKDVAGVIHIIDIKGRNHGNQNFIDVTIAVSAHLSVLESHTIADEIEEKVKQNHPNTTAFVHIEPFEQTIET